MKVPFNAPTLVGKELDNIVDALARQQLSGDGYYTMQCQRFLQDRFGFPKTLLTHSCTAALEMAAILCGIADGDEVIMPSFTFVSTANAVCLRNGIPVFVDVDPSTQNITAETIRPAITPRTKAIFVVHYAGVICDMDPIMDLAREHGIRVVEDAAQAFGSTYKGRPAGTFGDFAAFSFHETKNIVSGEGGFLAVNDTSFFEQAEIIREKGTNRSRFLRGQVDKYTWVEVGSSYLPGELIAAFLYGQLEESNAVYERRRTLWSHYDNILAPVAHARGFKTPFVPEECDHNAHMYYIVFEDPNRRQTFIDFMRSHDITTPFHYVPLHSAPAGKRLGRTGQDMTATDRAGVGLVRLPLFMMSDEEQTKVLDALSAFFAREASLATNLTNH